MSKEGQIPEGSVQFAGDVMKGPGGMLYLYGQGDAVKDVIETMSSI